MFSNNSKVKLTAFSIVCLFVFSSLNAAQYSAQSMYAVLRGHDQQIKTLSARMNVLQDNYAAVVNSLNAINRQLQDEKQKNIRLQNTIDALKSQISSDRRQYKANLDNVINKVSQQTSQVINKISKQQAAAQAAYARSQSSRRSSSSGPAGNGNFAEYVVQPGATLSAIAKAYKVSVRDIKKANRLNNDIIKVGQKLYIPQD